MNDRIFLSQCSSAGYTQRGFFAATDFLCFLTNTIEDDIDEQEAEELLNECALILKSIPIRAVPRKQQLKASSFATPHRGSDTNTSLDSQCEMNHRDSLKAFRPSAALEAIVPRMSVIDILLSAEESVSKSNVQKCTVKQQDELYKHEQFL
ncbi:hypothetical protein CHS0354_008209 [Potamilus streckersoni]|uniref:Uncharacterized protein n=1 Tax=Potamilus streckersoni TaxID=2493646 RepID=A0AAE0VK72_9BIVA|nr:hypothetical protein CHS0354_008209 [Potamilus streckersoni]